ncbi:MAG: DUF2207 domain-containing protein [Candidatus Bathyarchaeota archaeon]|nr:MAG: DUF2207 domain-containing protein [Candidatus Bathyarchaeota archaeon]
MSERRQILTLVVVTAIIGILAVALTGYVALPSSDGRDIVVEEYRATFHADGTLEEEYTYAVRVQRFRMLYRNWEAPLSAEPLAEPNVEMVNVEPPEGALAYYKDHSGTVYVGGLGNAYSREIRSLAYDNEAGAFNPNYYPPGRYTVSYTFIVHPPIEHDDTHAHLNLKLAGEHMRYDQVTITFQDAEDIIEVYPHPPNLEVERQGSSIVVTGSSEEDELLEVELLMNREALNRLEGFPEDVANVKTRTENANSATNLKYGAATALRYGAQAFAIVMPALIYIVYYRYGREREYTVPRYLSYVPNRERKPWLVNQVFVKGVLDYDDDGFYATILDLHMRKKIRVTTKPGGLLIELLDTEVEEIYERRVIGFLQSLAEDGVFDTDRIEEIIEGLKLGEEGAAYVLGLRNRLVEITTSVDRRAASKFIVQGRGRLLPLVALSFAPLVASIALMATAPFLVRGLLSSFVLSFVSIIQAVIAVFAPPELYGRWRGDAYKEKLEWDAFAKHLSELSQIRRYPPEDVSMWGEWLVYGTALGVGDKVAKAMRALNVEIPEVHIASWMPIYFHPLVVASAPSKGRVSSGGFRGGGGFGGGSGFGGGGAGAR